MTMIRLFILRSGVTLGMLEPEQLKFLVSHQVKEHPEDQDFHINPRLSIAETHQGRKTEQEVAVENRCSVPF